MLSRLGKLSAAITIVGGAVLLRSEPAAAATVLEPCTAAEESAACTAAGTAWYQVGEDFYCGQYNGRCDSDGENITYGVSYYWNGTSPCPPAQPC